MKQKINYLLLFAFLTFIVQANFAQTGNEVMKKNRAQMLTDDQDVNITMRLVNSRGSERIRQIIRKSVTDTDENISQIFQFQAPADIKGTGFLSIEHTDRDDDRWLYLPAMKKTRRIPASEKSAKFMGSNFTYEDITTEKTNEFEYKMIENKIINGAECYVIEAVPNNGKTKSESGYSKRIIYVQKDNYLMVKVIYFDKKGKKIKELNNTKISKIAGTDKWRAHQMEMIEIDNGSKTILEYSNFKINEGIDKSLFTVLNLEKEMK